MAAPLPVKDWSDFGWFTTTYLPAQTISTLRQFAAFLEQSGGVYVGIRTGERKDSIVEKTKLAFQAMQQRNDFSRYQDIRQKCDAVGKPVPNRSYYAAPPPTFGGVPAGSSSSSSACMLLSLYLMDIGLIISYEPTTLPSFSCDSSDRLGMGIRQHSQQRLHAT